MRPVAARARTLLAGLALALVAGGCASLPEFPDLGGPGGADGSGDAEGGPRGGRDAEEGGVRLRDPLGGLRRMQVTDRRWREVFRDDFDTLDPAVWKTYDGVPGCCPAALWDSSMVRVEDSALLLDTALVDGQWLSGGVGAWDSPLEQRYGRWDMRVRTEADAGGVTVAGLLWPAEGGWPPEIDFYEIFETQPDRREMTVTNHYGEVEADGTHDATRRPVRGDFSTWKVVSVRWTPDEIQVVVDGRAVETITAPGQIPDVPMWFAVQTAMKPVAGEEPTFTGSRSTEIDWVRAYAPA
ncbi:hypothetical protein GCM10009737_22710 [Nocardioides lentus]|uniref:GH16 domain-containing protein n=1 Tax=Nocardioides lentus TaxID=338077 RepID=A0ABP5ASK0_9ACTN